MRVLGPGLRRGDGRWATLGYPYIYPNSQMFPTKNRGELASAFKTLSDRLIDSTGKQCP